MKNLIILMLLLGITLSLNSQIGSMIPAARLPDLEDGILPWQKAGYISQLEDVVELTRFIEITDLGAVGDGLNDATAAVDSALALADSTSENGGFTMIYFPAGTYLITASIYLSSNTVLKGSGSAETTLLFSLENGDYIEINGVNDSTRCVRAGVEDLSILRDDDNQTTSYKGMFFHFNYAENCWLSGVEAYQAARNHVYITYSDNIEIRGCYFHAAESYGGGGHGYGVQIGFYSSKCLIEDNIFRRLRHAMLFTDAAHHNVFGYNFAYDQHTDNEILGLDYVTADMCLHGHNYPEISGPYENLFEGNIGSFVRIDDAHGSNGDYNTVFRNKAREVGLEINDVNDNQNIVNNYFKCGHYGLSLYGYAWLVDGSSHLKKNNKCRDRDFWGSWETHWHNNDPDYNADISYYHEIQPDFMQNHPWPLYPEDDDNPARDRNGADSIKTVFSGYKNFSIKCRGNVSLDEDLAEIEEVIVRFTTQDSSLTFDISPDSSGHFEYLFRQEALGIYDLEFSLRGYESSYLDSLRIMPFEHLPEIPDVVLNYINMPPDLESSLPDLELLEDFAEIETNLYYYFSDLENDTLDFWAEFDSNNISVSIQDSILKLNSVPNWNGITEVIVLAEDSNSEGIAQDSFLVDIMPVNDLPFITEELPELGVVGDSAIYNLNLNQYFRDVDSALEFEVLFDSLQLDCTLSDSILTLEKLLCWPLETSIEICAAEANEGASICDTLLLYDNIAGQNPPFLMDPVEDIVRFPDYEEIKIDLYDVFHDCDDDPLEFNVYFNYNQLACSIESDTLFINYLDGWLGSSFINITAEDSSSALAALDGFTVTVVPDSLNSPEILTVEIMTDSVKITWREVDYAESYEIYSANLPYSAEWSLEVDGIVDTTLVLPAVVARKFFRIKAVNEY